MAQEKLNEELNEEDSVLVLENEDGEEVEFNHIATIDYKDDWYVLLQPVELGDLAEDEIIIFKLTPDENGNDMFEPIEDEAIIDAVYAEYEKCYCEDCDCDDEDCDCEECKCDDECDCDDKDSKEDGCGCGCGCGCNHKE